MSFLLDSNAVIAIIGERRSPARATYLHHVAAKLGIAIPAVVYSELWYGVVRSRRRDASAARLSHFVSTLDDIVAFDEEDALTAAEIRAHLAMRGTPIGPYDVLIAAQALRRDATLVTANLDEFARVPGLKCVNWEESR